MKLDKESRKRISDAQKIADAISSKPKINNDESGKIDLTKLAKDLADRREKALSEEK